MGSEPEDSMYSRSGVHRHKIELAKEYIRGDVTMPELMQQLKEETDNDRREALKWITKSWRNGPARARR